MELDTTNKQVTTLAQNTTSDPIVNPSIPNQKGFVPIVIGVVILLIVVAGGAYYVGTRQTKPAIDTPTVNQPTPATNLKQTITPPSPSVNANWKTYTNSKFNYSLQYPSNWDKLEVDEGNYVRFFKGVYNPNLPIPETYISILPKANPSRTTVRDWLISQNILPKENDISTHIQEKNVTVGGISGVQITTPVNGGQDTVYLPVAGQILQITYIFKGENQSDYDNLVQTYNQLVASITFR